jgi:hypothetical protein
MAFTSYADIFDPEVLQDLVGQKWLDEAKIVKTGIIKRDTRPNKGTLVTQIRQTRFQNTSGQAVTAGGSISSQKKVQTTGVHPVIWRYQSADDPNVVEDIGVKDIPRELATMANDIKNASTQYVDDSCIAVIKGTGARLTGNQADGSASVISLTDIVDGKAALDDKGLDLDGGAMAMRSEIYWKMVKVGLVAATANTFGVMLQDQMVKEGKLPMNVLGLTPIVSNKFASLGANKFYVYLIAKEALTLKGSDVPIVEVAKATANKKFSTITNFLIKYGIGFNGVKWNVGGKENVTDTELAAVANWTLFAANEKDVLMARVKVKTA